MLCGCVCWAWPDWVDEVGEKWRILSHRSGPWVINAGGQRLLMPEVPARWLVPLEGRRPKSDEVLDCLRRGNQSDGTLWTEKQILQTMASLKAQMERPAANASRRALWLRVPILSALVVQKMARPLETLTKGWALIGMALWGLVVPLLPLTREGFGLLKTGDWLVAAGLFLLGAVLHELGHAAALSDQGYPAGGIGAGILFVIPVLHNDVSAIAMLPKKGKLRVDLAGISFQAAYGAVLILVASNLSLHSVAVMVAARLTYGAVIWNMIPFIRADGYWALCDVLGFQDLDRVCRETVSRPKLIFKLIHRLMNIVFLGFVAVVLPVIWAGRLGAFLPAGWGAWSTVIVPVLVLLLWGAVARRIFKLIGAFVRESRYLHVK